MNGQVVLRVLRALFRSVVFLAGMVGGFAIACVVIFFGGSAATDFAGVFFGFGLMLAAPLCWIAAVRGRKGDAWTLGYMAAWLAFYGLGYVLEIVEGDKPIKLSDNAVGVAFALLGILYLLVLPVSTIVFRRRRRSEQCGSGA